MSKKRFNPEQIVVLLRQVEVLMLQAKTDGLPGNRNFAAELSSLAKKKMLSSPALISVPPAADTAASGSERSDAAVSITLLHNIRQVRSTDKSVSFQMITQSRSRSIDHFI
ncbi:hypothetical protein [Tardiphaga sp. 367_B4_N1_1]|uniref:hypothetical protein n=1 Tax=Tardiphaga sp. 367_B4_N1_1 TaxID=3240777 RepID=UPI003F220EFF